MGGSTPRKSLKTKAHLAESPVAAIEDDDESMLASSEHDPSNAIASSSSSSSEGSSDESSSSSSSSDDESEDELSKSAPTTSPLSPTSQSKKRKRAELEPLPELAEGEEDVPALSHAEKRRQKKKLAKGSGDASTSASVSASPVKEAKSDAATTTARQSRQNSIWVGNLSYKTTEADLRKFFEDAGEITRVNLPLKPAAAGQPGAKWKSARENRGCVVVSATRS
jgi:hypothetical protein